MNPRSFAVLALTLALGGCPQAATSPVAEASTIALDQRLIGKWHCIGGGNEEGGALTISRSTPTEFAVLAQSGKDDPERYRLHSAKSGTVPLVNIEELKASEPKPWGLARMTLWRPSVLQIELASDERFKAGGTRPADAVAQGLLRGDLFEDGIVCARASTSGP